MKAEHELVEETEIKGSTFVKRISLTVGSPLPIQHKHKPTHDYYHPLIMFLYIQIWPTLMRRAFGLRIKFFLLRISRCLNSLQNPPLLRLSEISPELFQVCFSWFRLLSTFSRSCLSYSLNIWLCRAMSSSVGGSWLCISVIRKSEGFENAGIGKSASKCLLHSRIEPLNAILFFGFFNLLGKPLCLSREGKFCRISWRCLN